MSLTKEQRKAVEAMPGEQREAVERLAIPIDRKWSPVGVPGDPRQCDVAVYCRTYLNASEALIWSTVAYVSRYDAQGKLWCERYQVSTPMKRHVIARVDAGEQPVPGVYWLNPPAPSNTRAYKQAHYQRAVAEGRVKPGNSVRKPRATMPLAVDIPGPGQPGFLRNGSGQVRFP